MNSHLKAKMVLCPVIIIAIAVIPPLLLRATPWPIPIHVHDRGMWRLWRDVSNAEQIYVVQVSDIRGIVNRTATLDVVEVIKGGPLTQKIEEPLGRVVGSDDNGNIFLVFAGPGGWLPAVYNLGNPRKPAGVYVPYWGATFAREEVIEVIKELVHAHSNDKHLSEDQMWTLERYVNGDRVDWYWLIEYDVKEFLREKLDSPGVEELLREYEQPPE